MTSIRHHPSEQTQVAAPNVAVARLPDFCNLGIMLRLLIIVNLLCIAAAVVRSTGRDGWEQFLMISAVAQPVIILSLLAFCALRRLLNKLTYWRGVATIFAGFDSSLPSRTRN